MPEMGPAASVAQSQNTAPVINRHGESYTYEDQDPAIRRETVTYLENIVRAQTDAVNRREISADNPVYASHCTKDFVHLATPPWICENSTLEEMLDRVKRTFVEDPEYTMVITDLSTEITFGGRWAKVFLSFDAHGHPPGMIRPFMAIHRFRKDDGVWKLYAIEATTGVM